MTCILGTLHENKIIMGADSSSISSYIHSNRNDSKIFVKKSSDNIKYLFGGTTSWRMIQIFRYAFNIPKYTPGTDVFEFLCTDFITELRKTFKDEGFSTINSNTEVGGQFLLGTQNQLFLVDSDFQIMSCDFNAIGIGKDFALASFKTLQENSNINIETKILKSLEISEYFSIGVKSPFTILTI